MGRGVVPGRRCSCDRAVCLKTAPRGRTPPARLATLPARAPPACSRLQWCQVPGPERGRAGQVCLEYLERYYVLITFTAFLFDPAMGPAAPPPGSFGQWAARRPELHRHAPKVVPPHSLSRELCRKSCWARLGGVPRRRMPYKLAWYPPGGLPEPGCNQVKSWTRRPRVESPGVPPCRSVLERMLRRNPLAALALHRPARPDPPSPAPQHGPPADVLPGGASDDEEARETAEARPALPCPAGSRPARRLICRPTPCSCVRPGAVPARAHCLNPCSPEGSAAPCSACPVRAPAPPGQPPSRAAGH